MKALRIGMIAIALMVAMPLIYRVLGTNVSVRAGSNPTSTPSPPPSGVFDQGAALSTLREQTKGRESEPAERVFKNIQTLKTVPAGRFLAIMEIGFARSLGVNCTHCHIPDKWEVEDKTQKQTARDMWAMVGRINGELLKNIKNLKSETPTVNCTTCHRGSVIPAVNLPPAPR